jgi:hypothetical protein
MAENNKKCAHQACDCLISADDKFCSEYCENAEKARVTEIGCGCEHQPCR